ncbi:hypothetical protein ACTXT7_009681 [Hymenolepis weldensis]
MSWRQVIVKNNYTIDGFMSFVKDLRARATSAGSYELSHRQNFRSLGKKLYETYVKYVDVIQKLSQLKGPSDFDILDGPLRREGRRNFRGLGDALQNDSQNALHDRGVHGDNRNLDPRYYCGY